MDWPITITPQGLYVPTLGWLLDSQEPQEEGFISHAHYDHVAPHGIGHATLLTSLLLEKDKRAPQQFEVYEYHKPYKKGGVIFQLLPSGHIPGSAELFMEIEDVKVLYAGDVRMKGSPLCPPAETPQADLLIVEGTFGESSYHHDPVETAMEEALHFVHACHEKGKLPLFITMGRVGKPQDLVWMLSQEGYVGGLQRSIFQATEACRKSGMPLTGYGNVHANDEAWDYVILTHYYFHCFLDPWILPPFETAFLSGWARDHGEAYHKAIPWSDHGDVKDLFAFVEKVNPKEVWTFDDQGRFAHFLRANGVKAYSLDSVISR